jgi:hypothetical protein
MKEFGRLALLVAAGSVSLAGVARAGTVTATLDGVSPAQVVGLSYNNQWLGYAYAGALNWHGQVSNGQGLDGKFTTFCIDLTQDVYVGSTYTYDVADPNLAPNPLPPTAPAGATGMGSTNLQRLENLYALEYDNIGTDNDRGAAFQLAIWEMLFDTNATHDVSTGQFAVSGASADVVNLANQFVADATTSDALAFHSQLMALTNATAQDQLFIGPPVETAPGPRLAAVPTPAAAVGALPLLGGLALFKQRRRRDGL